jgi:hypothetical protein
MSKSTIDELFYNLYGFYPNKAGQAYEMIVAAALKVITKDDIKYDQRERGIYSETLYQQDSVVYKEKFKTMIEAKDYTINIRKVG